MLIVRFLAMNLWSDYETIHYYFSRYSKIIDKVTTGKCVRGFGYWPCERTTGAKVNVYHLWGMALPNYNFAQKQNLKTGSDADTTLQIVKMLNCQTFSGRLKLEWFMGCTGKDLNICIRHWVWLFRFITNDRLTGLFNMI